jgi:hypothetical protein
MLSTILSCLVSIPLTVPAACTHQAAAKLQHEFERTWYDGQAEVNGYHWQGTRYGQLRRGEAVAIFVTEPMGAMSHVKLDDVSKAKEGVVTVMKLNLVRDFQTGVYDYNTMTSVFAEESAFQPMKISFSSAEWCGHVYEELNVRERGIPIEINSYFEGESSQSSVALKPGGLIGDQIFVWLRGLRGHVLEAGETKSFPYLADAFERRLRHVKAEWGEITITRDAAGVEAGVPFGVFNGIRYRVVVSDGRQGTFLIEDAWPHRLLAWQWARGEEILDAGELTGSRRMQYWSLHDNGHEALRKDLGLPVPE